MTEEQKSINIHSEGLKLIKNSKGYTWEIKITEIDVKKLASINKTMLEQFKND